MTITPVSVKIVGFLVEGTSVKLTFQFSNKKRLTRVFSLTEAQNKRYRIGAYILIHMGADEYQQIFREESPKPVVVEKQEVEIIQEVGEKPATWVDLTECQ